MALTCQCGHPTTIGSGVCVCGAGGRTCRRVLVGRRARPRNGKNNNDNTAGNQRGKSTTDGRKTMAPKLNAAAAAAWRGIGSGGGGGGELKERNERSRCGSFWPGRAFGCGVLRGLTVPAPRCTERGRTGGTSRWVRQMATESRSRLAKSTRQVDHRPRPPCGQLRSFFSFCFLFRLL